MQNSYFVGLDIGSTAVRCIIGQLNEHDIAPTVIGTGVSPNLGVRKGSIVNIQDTVNAIDAAIEIAERMAGYEVGGATVNVNGSHIIGMNSKGVVAISSSTREIGQEDVSRVEEAATVVQLPTNREIIQVFARDYRLDGQDHIRDPVGMTGVRLEVDAHVVTASTPSLRNLEKAMDGAGTQIHYRLLGGLAAAEAVINRDQRENGVLIIDYGATTTNVAVFEEGDVQHVAVIPVGSHNITNDLAIGLRTEIEIAEAVKLAHLGPVSKGRKANLSVKVGDEEHTFKQSDVDHIIQARLEETLDLVDDELDKVNRSGKLPGGVVLVGGGANLKGLSEYVKKRLKLPARISKPHGFAGLVDTIDSPEFATAIGLMLYDMHASGQYGANQNSGSGLGSAMAKFGQTIKSWLSRLKP
ncbi:MAG TPA: cell division protein FtsA [Candidatus Saccharimonadales bacterium]|jgi:cell division protein FtsA